MLPDRLIACIEQRSPHEFEATFVASATLSRRKPAVRLCSSYHEARKWVEAQAATFNVPVEWVDRPPQVAG